MQENQKSPHIKSWPKILLIVYVILLLWLVLFKFSFDILSILSEHQMRSLNLIPFNGHLREMIENFIVFVPLGLLLSMNIKKLGFWQKLACIFTLSLSVEVIQFACAIGITDITDLITNTLGGLFGLIAYTLGEKYIGSKRIDPVIITVIALLAVVFLVFRLFVLRVKY